MTTKEHLKMTVAVVGGLLLAITIAWLYIAPKWERQKLGELDRIGLTILVDDATRRR